MDNQLKEILVGNNRIFLRDDGILVIIVVGDLDAQLATGICETVLKIKGGRANVRAHILVDNTLSGKQNPEARKIFKSRSNGGNDIVAIVGLHPVARVLASFFLSYTSKDKARFFGSEKEAIKWLLSKTPLSLSLCTNKVS